MKALIFDVDGTLADTERDAHRVAFNRAFADAQLDWNWTESLYGELLTIAGGKERIRYYLDRFLPDESSRVTAEQIAALHAAKTQHYTQLIEAGTIALRPGVRRLIEEARQQDIRLAIATTSAPKNAIALLEHSLAPNSPAWFEVIAAGDIVPQKKPAPDVYLYVLDQLGLQPEECLAIEDSEHGLAASVQAGIPTLVTVNDYTRSQTFEGAIAVVEHLGEPDLPTHAIAGNRIAGNRIAGNRIAGNISSDSSDSYITLETLRTLHQLNIASTSDRQKSN